MNVFHWHMTDTHSFPIELDGELTSDMTQYGAYDENSIYTKQDMADILQYANDRGTLVKYSIANKP